MLNSEGERECFCRQGWTGPDCSERAVAQSSVGAPPPGSSLLQLDTATLEVPIDGVDEGRGGVAGGTGLREDR